MSTLSVGSLFSGIGGLDLGLERAGMRVIWQSEIDPYASRVLAKHWPDVPNLGDITKVDWSTVERPDVICGGYPCQPFSYAGRRAGTGDPRHLWPFFADALRHLRPRWALLENVPGHLSLGFDEVLADLAALGFDAEWELLPAAAFGAPHLRFRLFVVAYSGGRRGPDDGLCAGGPSSGRRSAQMAYADGPGPQRHRGECRLGEGRGEGEASGGCDVGGASEPLADAHPSRRNGRPGQLGSGRWGEPAHSGWWESEPDVGRVASRVPSRVDRLRCLGNSVVPQVAEYVGRQIVNAND